MARCCWDCKKITVEETAQAKLAKAFQSKVSRPEIIHRGKDLLMACPVTGGVLLPASEAMLKKVWTGCMELTCFEAKED